MTPPRLQVESPVGPVPVRPVASPVDTFAPTTAGTKLAQLAQGLATFSPTLQRFGAVLQERQNKQQQAAGAAQARLLAEQGKTFAQAVKEGLAPRHANPFFIAGFREQFGRVTADRWQSDLVAAIAKNETLQTTTKMEDFDAFVVQQRADWLKQNVAPGERDKYFETGFGYRADAYLAAARNSFAAQLGQRIGVQADEALFQEAKGHVMRNAKADPATIAVGLTKLAKDMLKQSRDGTEVNQTIARAIAAAAMESGEDGLNALEAMTQVMAGKGPLSNTTYGTELYRKARDYVTGAMLRQDAIEKQAAAERQKAEEDKVVSEAIRALAENPRADMRPLALRLADINPDIAGQLASLQQNMTDLSFVTDQGVKRDLYSGIWAGEVKPEQILRAMNAGDLQTPDAAWLLSQYGMLSNAEGQGANNPLSDPAFRTILNAIPGRFMDPATGVLAADRAGRALFAKAQLMESYIGYLDGPGAKASPRERIAWLTEEAERVVAQQGGGAFTINKPPLPEFTTVAERLPKEPVLTPNDIRVLGASGILTPAIKQAMDRYRISTPFEFSQFIRSQMRLLGIEEAAPDPNAKKKKKK